MDSKEKEMTAFDELELDLFTERLRPAEVDPTKGGGSVSVVEVKEEEVPGTEESGEEELPEGFGKMAAEAWESYAAANGITDDDDDDEDSDVGEGEEEEGEGVEVVTEAAGEEGNVQEDDFEMGGDLTGWVKKDYDYSKMLEDDEDDDGLDEAEGEEEGLEEDEEENEDDEGDEKGSISAKIPPLKPISAYPSLASLPDRVPPEEGMAAIKSANEAIASDPKMPRDVQDWGFAFSRKMNEAIVNDIMADYEAALAAGEPVWDNRDAGEEESEAESQENQEELKQRYLMGEEVEGLNPF